MDDVIFIHVLFGQINKVVIVHRFRYHELIIKFAQRLIANILPEQLEALTTTGLDQRIQQQFFNQLLLATAPTFEDFIDRNDIFVFTLFSQRNPTFLHFLQHPFKMAPFFGNYVCHQLHQFRFVRILYDQRNA